jgi:8-oxo-dGTP diphosphatase
MVVEKVSAIVIKDKRILLVKERGKDFFITPGGKREVGEENITTLQRELTEELNTMAINPVFYCTFEGQAEGFFLRMFAYLCDLASEPIPCSEIDELAWYDTSTNVKVSKFFEKNVLPKLLADGLIV